MARSLGSVGRAFESNLSFGINHPVYQNVVAQIDRKTTELATVKGEMRRSATPFFNTVALRSEEVAQIAAQYPELRIVNVGYIRASHPLFVASRRAAMSWCVLQAKKLTDQLVVYGTPLLSVIESGFADAVMYVDGTNPNNVHERHTAAMDARKTYSDYVSLSKESGVSLNRASYDKFLKGQGVRVSMTDLTGVQAQVVCVDGMMNAYGPMQVAMLMEKNKASVCYGTVPYDPEMLTCDKGFLLNYGVGFQRTDESIRFVYPDGNAGVSEYSLDAWSAWLTSHTFSMGVSNVKWYQLELLKNRDGILFYRLTKLECKPTSTKLIHALELPNKEPMYVVRGWRLKQLGMDPGSSDSWISQQYLASKRLVDRVYQHALNLPREQFTRFAIRKYISVANDNITIEGTTVKTSRPLRESTIDALVSDIFSRAFSDRYSAGTLTEQAKQMVDQLSAFGEMPYSNRLWLLTSISALGFWEATSIDSVGWLRVACDKLISMLATKKHDLSMPTFEVAATYVVVGEGAKLPGHSEGLDVVREITRRSGLGAVGFGMTLTRMVAQAQKSALSTVHGFSANLINLFETAPSETSDAKRLVELVKSVNPMDQPVVVRRELDAWTVTRAISGEVSMNFVPVADPAYIFSEFHSLAFPGIAERDLEFDTASISLDPQDRHLAAPYMKLPKYFGDAPKPKLLYHSKIRALNVPKRQQTLQELISAINARNCSDPKIALPQDDRVTALAVWNNFLDKACEPNAREKLKSFANDPVGLEEEGLLEWVTQSTPDKVLSVISDLEDTARALGDMDVGDYMVMLKSDVKPTMSMKPMYSRTEPQVIVYHEKPLSAFYSSIFRVLVRRFLSLLKPNIHVNLLKDSKDIEAFVRGVHPYDKDNLAYLENDFSKYDKSQGRFVFILEQLIFTELGMNQSMLSKWLRGHEKCKLRAVGLGLSLHVMYQRKSGDATTAFGNVLLNITSVMYAYKPAIIHWGVFMGDDSLICTVPNCYDEEAVQILAEVFNLGAKMYCTTAPYFASNFFVINNQMREVFLIPDPVKRIERWSMMVSGDDPQWMERYVSARDAMVNYLSCAKTASLPRMIGERYSVPAKSAAGLADAVATAVSSGENFRSMWEEIPRKSFY